MLVQAFSKIKTTSIMLAIIVMVIGIIMLLCPNAYVFTLIDAIGYIMLIVALVMIFDFISGGKKTSDIVAFITAMLLIIAGIAVLVFHDDILLVIGIIFGILLIIEGLGSFAYTITFVRRAGRKGWLFLAILSILLILSGVMILINPWWYSEVEMLKVIGATLVFSSIISLLRILWMWPVQKKQSDEAKTETA